MKIKYHFIVFLFLSLCAFADNNPVGGRQAALGGSCLTLSDVWSTQNNQAGLGFLKEGGVGAYYENRFLIKQLAFNSLVAALPVSKIGAIGLTYTGFGYNAYKETKAGLAYGMRFGEYFSAGVQLNYFNTKINDIYGNTGKLTAEIGFIGKLTKQVSVAAHVYNVNRAKLSSYNNEIIPAQIRVGLQYTFSSKVMAIAEAEKSSHSGINFKGGIEYLPVKELYLRAGASSNPVQTAFGIGVNLKAFKLDLSSNYHQVLGFSPMVSLSFGFGRKETSNATPENP